MRKWRSALLLAILPWLGSASVVCAIVPAPPNDACPNATVISTVPYTDSLITSAATTESRDPTPECGPTDCVNGCRGKTVWYLFAAPSTGTVTADTLGPEGVILYDTVLSTYSGACDNLTPVPDGCNDDDPLDGAQSRVSFPAVTGTTYYFMVSAFRDDGGSLTFHMRFTVTGPLGDANCDGRVTAADLPELLQLLSTSNRAPCGRDDANGDLRLDAADLSATIGALFAP